MILPVSEEWRIRSDKHGFHCQRYIGLDKVTGEPSWRSELYYSTILGAANGISQQTLRDSDATTLAEALEEVFKITEVMTKALNPHIKLEIT